MIRKYSYQCRDYSILTPIFKKYLVEPLIVLIPISIPANIVTIVSNLFVYLSVTLAFIYGNDARWNFILIPISLTVYIIGDHLDGLQAKRTGTSSALGEFCDHFLDTFNTGLILLIMFQLFNVQYEYLMIYLMTTSYLAHASIFYHQFKTGWLVFEKFGSLEAMVLTIILLFLSFLPGVYDLLTTAVWKFTIIEYLLMLSSVGALATFTKTLVDTKTLSTCWLWFCLLFIVLALFLAATDPGNYLYSVLILYPSLYIGGLMHGHLIDGRELFPDILSVLMLGAVFFINQAVSLHSYLLYYLVLRVCFLTFTTFYALRSHWVWVNPKTAIK
ncbi:MAG: hypothetical protein DHS20C17_30280 [Cyclobacteriaceae bacterium]|nr:MAG: hypothetical protein DHS20C17_30280 [Cyclobacteriaceae bacterium]